MGELEQVGASQGREHTKDPLGAVDQLAQGLEQGNLAPIAI